MRILVIKMALALFVSMTLMTNLTFAEDNSELDIKLQEAENYLKLRDFDKGIELLNNLIEDDPENAEYHSRIGGVYYFLKQNEKAIFHLDKAIELDRNNPDHYMMRSMATDDFQEQEKWLMKALELAPQHDGSIAILVSMYIANAIGEEAKCQYENALTFTQKGIKIMRDYLLSFEESPETKDPEILKISSTMILPQVKERLAGAEEMELNLRKKIEEKIPCKNTQ